MGFYVSYMLSVGLILKCSGASCKLFNLLSLFPLIAGLGEFRIRDLNDEINKLLREKGHWEVRIRELGGPDYAVSVDYFVLCSSSAYK